MKRNDYCEMTSLECECIQETEAPSEVKQYRMKIWKAVEWYLRDHRFSPSSLVGFDMSSDSNRINLQLSLDIPKELLEKMGGDVESIIQNMSRKP